MYLMNVPPVAATQTEWRRCGPPGGFSLPVCFNDSDTELSARGTPISDKVQMIIESLRSTQSSLEMGDEIEGNVLSGEDGQTPVCQAAVGSYVAAKCKTKTPADKPQPRGSSSNHHDSSDSDSDDSVDRGIEEAILEYLKEKDDHKRKAEPLFQSAKIPRRDPSIHELSRQTPESHMSVVSSSQFLRHAKAETPPAPATIPIKKYIKNKASLDENFQLGSSSTKSLLGSREILKIPSKTISISSKNPKCPIAGKVEEESIDSSTDDGIEEAIQRFQLEKKEHQNKRETFTPHAIQVESDSTSDDGIEEAIRTYQLEQLKERSVFKPFLQKQKPFGKALMHAVESTSLEGMKKHKLKKKKVRTEKPIRSLQPHPSSALIPTMAHSNGSKGKGNGLLSSKADTFKERAAPTPPKANTTAELMCAEAILDISKTVMPEVFHHTVGIETCAPTSSSSRSSVPESCLCEDSDDSSIDSEDGIEQEIRKFLEQKAQMHMKPTTSEEPHQTHEPVREVAVQNKPLRLSLTQRRKSRENNCIVSNVSGANDKGKETSLKASLEPTNPAAFPQRHQTHTASHKKDQSGDKSSSLDSDEDLDTAIKDLLKTKRKSKKKIRDLKRKSRKSIKEEEPMSGSDTKFKPEPTPKTSALKKVHKSKEDMKDKSGGMTKTLLLLKQTDGNWEHSAHEGETETLEGAEGGDDRPQHAAGAPFPERREDSSSGDSDDGIEQEIQRFLAEKAKVSSAEKPKDADAQKNGTAEAKREPQLAEIPRKSGGAFPGALGRPLQDRAPQRPPDICPVSAQSCVSAAQSCGAGLLEPADGAGAARTEQRRPDTGREEVSGAGDQVARERAVPSPSLAHSRAESIKWRQSFGLPISEPRTLSRTPFHITTSEVKESPPAPLPPYKDLKAQTQAAAWFSPRTTRSPLSGLAETAVNTTARPPVLNFMSASRQHSKMSFAQSLTQGPRSQFSLEEERARMVQMPKDKSVFVELESNMTNHVQVQSREKQEGKERGELLSDIKREGESMKIDDKDVHQVRKEEEFIDESDCESGSRRDPGKKQGFSTLSLSRAIDPGFTFSPCFALTTEERSKMSSRRYLVKKCMKDNASLVGASKWNTSTQHVKRKLQFVPLSRTKELQQPAQQRSIRFNI
ncbi:protein phosphatase 1 regulatory subunit 26 isoform 1-T2 [Menidia menidia]